MNTNSMKPIWQKKVKDYYASNPAVYTQAGHDRWEPHYMYIGEVVEAIEQ